MSQKIVWFLFIFCVDLINCNVINVANNSKGREVLNDDDYFDWRERGAVSPVKDQGPCQACWAFSIVANIESQYKIEFGENLTLSEQFLIDCLNSSRGCDTETSILKSLSNIVADIGGVLQNKDYPSYVAEKKFCRWNNSMNTYPIPVVGFKRVKADEDEMAKYLRMKGPLIAGINAKSMSNYTRDVIDDPTDCDPNEMNHSVLIVGYNTYVNGTERVPYWIIKNSWGVNWGDKGFYYLVRGRNACGIASDVSFAFVD